MNADLDRAHKHCFENEAELNQSKAAGCFYCLAIFNPSEIDDWVRDDGSNSAICPKCGIDSVIGDKSGFPITPEFLTQMHKRWFDNPIKGSYLTKLGKTLEVIIDRPAGSKHPEHGFLYPINYGFIGGTKAPDGEEIDAYVLGANEPLEKVTGKCIAIIHRTNDNDDKLVISINGKDFSDDEINKLTNFQEQFFNHVIIRKRLLEMLD